jgi:hypothetical protein
VADDRSRGNTVAADGRSHVSRGVADGHSRGNTVAAGGRSRMNKVAVGGHSSMSTVAADGRSRASRGVADGRSRMNKVAVGGRNWMNMAVAGCRRRDVESLKEGFRSPLGACSDLGPGLADSREELVGYAAPGTERVRCAEPLKAPVRHAEPSTVRVRRAEPLMVPARRAGPLTVRVRRGAPSTVRVRRAEPLMDLDHRRRVDLSMDLARHHLLRAAPRPARVRRVRTVRQPKPVSRWGRTRRPQKGPWLEGSSHRAGPISFESYVPPLLAIANPNGSTRPRIWGALSLIGRRFWEGG